jgi:hypothetical protein
MRGSFSSPRGIPSPTWALSLRLLLWLGSTAAPFRFLVTAHNAVTEREQTLPAHELLSRTDDLSSQHTAHPGTGSDAQSPHPQDAPAFWRSWLNEPGPDERSFLPEKSLMFLLILCHRSSLQRTFWQYLFDK